MHSYRPKGDLQASPGTGPITARADGAARRHCHAGRNAGEASRRRHLHRVAGSRHALALPRPCRRTAGLMRRCVCNPRTRGCHGPALHARPMACACAHALWHADLRHAYQSCAAQRWRTSRRRSLTTRLHPSHEPQPHRSHHSTACFGMKSPMPKLHLQPDLACNPGKEPLNLNPC